MTSYEFTGKSVKEAVAKACAELKMDEALLEIEILEESTRGFLGLVGQRNARVRVRKRDILKEVMEVQEPEESPQVEAQAEESEAVENDLLPEPPEQRVAIRSEFKALQEDSPKIQEAEDILKQILGRMPVEVEVVSSITNGAIYLDIKGDGSGLLIGKKGQTLDALQYLMNKIINRENPPNGKVEVIVDTENYRIRKKETLKEMALKMSLKAKKTLKPVSLNPMPPHERRIIHLILAEDREVYTKSYGEGPLRRIIVYPRRGMANKRRRR